MRIRCALGAGIGAAVVALATAATATAAPPIWEPAFGSTIAPITDDAAPAIDRVVFTWDSVFFSCEAAAFRDSCRARAQVQLFESGRIVFGYDGVLTNQAKDDYPGPNGGAPTIMPAIAKGGFVAP